MNDYKVNVEIHSQVNELFSKTKVIQKFRNPDDNPLELKVYVYKNNMIIFSSFTAQIGDSIKVKSKVILKEKAEEKFSDAIASGNAAINVYEDSYNDRLVLNMGNIPPKEEMILICEFIQLTENSESYEFELFRNLPIFIGNKDIYQNINLKGKIEIRAQNEIFILKKELLLKNIKINKEIYKKEEKIYLIDYQIDKLPEFEMNRKKNLDYIPSSKIYFEIKNEKDIQAKIYYQKSNLNSDENNYILNIKNNYKSDDKLYPALFIFLIDQSGSMDGEPIKIVSKALELFLQSIPKDSYYQLIGFGSEFQKYDDTPKQYTKDNIKESLKVIKSLNADLGGTNIYSPLKSIYDNEKEYDKIQLPKNIFLLTDGEIDDKNKTLQIIDKFSSKFSIFSIGIGDSFDQELIKNAGILGKGGYNFCKNLNNLNSIIIKEINKVVRPFIADFSMKCSLDNTSIYSTNDNIPKIFRKNQLINFGYITKDKYNNITVELEYSKEKKLQKNKFEIIPEEIENGEELSKLIIKNYLYLKNLEKEEIEKIALKYQVLTEYTSLFAEIELSNKITDEMRLKILGKSNNNNSFFDYNKFHFSNLNHIYECEAYCEMNDIGFLSETSGLKMKSRDPYSNTSIVGGGYYSSKKKGINFGFLSIFGNCCKKVDKTILFDSENEINLENNDKNNKNESEFEEEENEDSKVNFDNENKYIKKKLNKDELLKILNTQDFIEGFWDYNEKTKYMKDNYLNIFNLLKDKKKYNDKIAMTILIIFILENDYKEFLNEFDLIIKKAKIFIKKEIVPEYDEIIKDLKL